VRYVYLGDAQTDPALRGRPCDPVRDVRGKCVVSTKMASALVIFEGESVPRVVNRRRLRLAKGVSEGVSTIKGHAKVVAPAPGSE
jgi:hypothetical protein